MNNILAYAQNNFDTFEERPLSAIDSLILSTVSYIHFPDILPEIEDWTGMRLQELFRAEHFEEMFHGFPLARETKQLFFVLAASPRFRDIRVKGYTEQYDTVTEKQFSAVTFQILPRLSYIAFRGTDSTFIGWKEDFNMAFQSPVPSQTEAVRYIEKAAFRCPGMLYAGGHSKGGNLAVYAAAMCRENVQSRILHVYSHDGPGFLAETMQSPEFRRIFPRIEKTLPQSSIVGMLLEHQENFRIVKSNRVGLWQHNPFTWLIDDNDFVYIDTLTKDARFTDLTLSEWLHEISEEDRERFVDSLYSILNANGMTTLDDFRADWLTAIPASLHAASQLDPETKRFLLHTLKELASMGIRNFPKFTKA